jgi:DNA polymerase-3 subunit beta
MNFVVSSKSLLQQLVTASGVVGSNSTLPILGDFLFSIQDGELTIIGSDLESTLQVKLPVESNENGSIAIEAKKLIEILKTFPDQPLTFTVNNENNTISVVSESGKYKLAGHNASEFPKVPTFESNFQFKTEAGVLALAIHKTIFATGNDELRPVMSGVFLELGGEKVNFVATDAHKLVKYSRSDIKSEDASSIILPKKPLNVLKSIITNHESEVTISFNSTNIIFSFENITMTSRLIEGKYPNYEAVIPKENPNSLTIDRNAFLNTLRRVSIFSNKTTYQVRLNIKGSELQVSAEDLDFSNEAFERLPCSYIGTDMEIGFNSKFLMEMLSNMDCENVTLNLSAPNRAGILVPTESPDENEELMMLVMPIMLNS